MANVTVAELWRFPVKSMGGQRVDEVRIDRRGVHADRLWAVRDLENDITASARRIPALLGCSARYAGGDPGPDAQPGIVPEVVITFPDGAEMSSAETGIDDRLSEVAGRDVRLTSLPSVGDTSQHRMSVKQSRSNFSAAQVRSDFGFEHSEPLLDASVFSPKQLLSAVRFATPPGTFVDLSPVHLMSSTSLTSLAGQGIRYDVRRFRPNILVDIEEPETAFPESAWVGGDVHVGSAVMRVTVPTIRCVVPTRPQPGLDLDRGLTRRLAERTDRFLGVYANVTQPGLLRVGDEVRIGQAPPPGVARRAATAVGKTSMRGLQRVLEATVLRDHS